MTETTRDTSVTRSSIRDVAAAAGVSVSTVSRALNGYDDVNAETRTKIEVTAERLGYRPSYAAAMLRKNQTDTVTFIVSKPWTKYVDPYFLGILDGLELALAAQNYDLQVLMARDFDTEIDVVRRVVDRNRSDAMIFARTRPVDERIDWLEGRGFPFVTVGRTLRDSHSFVDRDQTRLGRDAVRRLVALGHRRIGLLTTPLRYMYTQLTLQGIHAEMAVASLSPDPSLQVECFLSRKTGEDAVLELFTRGRAPTALICGNDLIAISAMEGLRKLGLRPGADVALIGCDDIPVAAYVRPALTTFSLDLEAVGLRLGRMILAKLNGDKEPKQETVAAQMVIRQSDCPGGDDIEA